MNGLGIRIEGLHKRYGSGDTAADALLEAEMTVEVMTDGATAFADANAAVADSFAGNALIAQFQAQVAEQQK